MRNAVRAVALIGLAIAAVFAISGCGSSSDSGDSGQGGDADVASAKAELAKYRAHPKFVPPGPKFDAQAAAAGKHVWISPNISSVPVVTEVEKSLEPALEVAGAEVTTETAEGAVSEWVSNLNTAISQNADAIVEIGMEPSQIAAPLAKAKAAGIPVIYVFSILGEPISPDVAGTVPINYPLFAKLLADAAVVDTNGDAHTAIFYTDQLPQDEPAIEEIKERYAQICPDCSVDVTQNIPVDKWATDTTGDTRSVMTANPEVNVLMPLHDSLAEYMVPALRSANEIGKMKVETHDATASVVEQIKSGAISTDLGWSNAWVGWATADQVLRALAGEPTLKDEKIATVVFDSSNAQDLDSAADVEKYFGDSYVDGYKSLWGIP